MNEIEKSLQQINDSVMLSGLLENMPMFIYFKDRKGRHIAVSKTLRDDYVQTYSDLTDAKDLKIIGKTDLDLYDINFAKRSYADDMSVINTGQPIIRKVEIHDSYGEIRYHSTTKVPIFNQENKVIGLVGITYEVTDQKIAEIKLEDINDSLKIINSILRHDILNKLNTSTGYLFLYQKKKDDKLLIPVESAIKESIDIIKQMKSLETLVLHFGTLKPFNLREVIEEKVKSEIIPKDIEINIEGEGEVFADQAIKSIIDNLIQNAVIHADTEKIDFEIIQNSTTCFLKVKDYGKGIPDNIKYSIFKPGFSHGQTGQSGFGLYIVSKIMTRYEGDIKVEDNEPNGTVFVLKFKRSNY